MLIQATFCDSYEVDAIQLKNVSNIRLVVGFVSFLFAEKLTDLITNSLDGNYQFRLKLVFTK